MLSGAPRLHEHPRESKARSRNTPRMYREYMPNQGIRSMQPRANMPVAGDGFHHEFPISPETTALTETDSTSRNPAENWNTRCGIRDTPWGELPESTCTP